MNTAGSKIPALDESKDLKIHFNSTINPKKIQVMGRAVLGMCVTHHRSGLFAVLTLLSGPLRCGKRRESCSNRKFQLKMAEGSPVKWRKTALKGPAGMIKA